MKSRSAVVGRCTDTNIKCSRPYLEYGKRESHNVIFLDPQQHKISGIEGGGIEGRGATVNTRSNANALSIRSMYHSMKRGKRAQNDHRDHL